MSGLTRHQSLLPNPAALSMWPDAWEFGLREQVSYCWASWGGGAPPGCSGSAFLPMALLVLCLLFIKFPAWADEAQMRAAFQGGEKEEEEGKNRKFPEHELEAG